MAYQTGKAYCICITLPAPAMRCGGCEAAPRRETPLSSSNSDREGRSEAEPGAARSRRAELRMRGAQERAIGFGSGIPERSPDCGASPEPGHGWPAEGSGGAGPETEMRTNFSAPRSGGYCPAGCGMNRLHELFGPTFLKERWAYRPC
jgi:hypothetical protein